MPVTDVSTGQILAGIREILLALADQIVDATGLDPAAVYITRRKDPPRNVREFAVGIWVRGERPDTLAPRAVDGGGRVNDMRSRLVTVQCWSRTVMDEADRDTNRLTDVSLGSIQLEDKVYDAIQLYQATNLQGDWLVTWPARTGAISDPVADAKFPDFTVSGIDLSINYARDLDQKVQ